MVLNWNGLEDTRSCVESLLAQTWPALEIHVADNGSDNGEADALETEFGDRIRVHRNGANLGFAGGNNRPIERILQEQRARYVALLNNDAEAEPGWIEALVATAEERPQAGLCASLMVFHHDPTIVENAGTLLLGSGEAVPRGRGLPAARFTTPADLLGACAGAALYRSSALAEAGLFREEFFANFEDVDLSLRLVALGWQCPFVPGAIVRHRLNRSIAKVRDDAFRIRSIRNLSAAYWINTPWQVLLLNAPWLLVTYLVIPLVTPLLGQLDLARILVAGRLRALRDLPDILAARRALAPRRRGSWWMFWCRQRWNIPHYLRYFADVVVLRRRRFME